MAQHKKLGGPLQQRFYDCCMNVKSAVIWRRNAGKVLSLSENNEPTFELLFDFLRLSSKQPFYLELLWLLVIFFSQGVDLANPRFGDKNKLVCFVFVLYF